MQSRDPTTHNPLAARAAGLAQDAQTVADFVAQHAPVLVLTGAGISTASGIPEYRDAEGNWKHAKPVQYRDFMDSPRVYQRYWARSAVGWQTMGRARPNAAHHALAQLEQHGYVGHLITQNVDRLHQQARQRNLVSLHGDLSTASCLDCSASVLREVLQRDLEELNRKWLTAHRASDAEQKPDGDAGISDHAAERFIPPQCASCGGNIKPDVVFFGETIPGHTLAAAHQAQQRARALLVVGSSLVVFSGFRIVRDFCARNLPVAIINLGKTRADELPVVKFQHDASELLPEVLARST